MRSQSSLLLGIACAGALATTWWSVQPAERYYKGKSSSTWIAQLRAADTESRIAAAEAMGHVLPNDGIELLQVALTDVSPLVRGNAAIALGRYGSAGLPALAQGLRHRRHDVRRVAAMGIGIAQQAAEPLIPALIAQLDDDDELARIEASRALARIGGVTVPALVAVMEGPSRRAREAAVNAFLELGEAAGPAADVLAHALRDPDGKLTPLAGEALSRIGAPAVPKLVAALADPAAHVRLQAADALSRLGAPAEVATDPLVARLADPEIPVRRAAADALGRIGANRAALALRDRLRDGAGEVRQAAAEALGRLGRAAVPAVPLLLELQADAVEAVRVAATDALLKIVQPEASAHG